METRNLRKTRQGVLLHAAEIGLLPDLQPFGYGDLLRRGVYAVIYGGRDLFQLPADFPLRLARDTALDLLPGAGVRAGGVPGLPIGVFFPFPDHGLLPDRAGSCC